MSFMTGLVVFGALSVAVLAAIIAVQLRRGTAKASAGGDSGRPSDAVDKISTRQGYRYADDAGLLIDGDTVWAYYQVGGLTDDLVSDEEVEDEVGGQAADLHSFAQNGSRTVLCHLAVTRRPFDTAGWAARLLDNCADPTANFRRYVHRWAARVARVGAATPVAYLGVRLGTLSGGSHLQAMPLPTVTGQRRTCHSRIADLISGSLIGVHEETLTPEQAGAWQSVAEYIPQALPHWRLTPASRRELVYLMREPWYGDLPVPDEPNLGSRPWGPGDFDLVLSRDALVRPTHLVLNPADVEADDVDGDARSVTATLVVTEWPREMRFNHNAAWMRRAVRTDQRVRVSYRFELLPPDVFAKKIVKASKDLNDEVVDYTKGARARTGILDATPEQVVPARLYEDAVNAAELATTVKEQHIPGVNALPRFVISAENIDQLREVAGALTRELARMDIRVEWPKKLQYRLFEERLLGEPPANPALARRHWGRLTEVETIPGGLPHATSEVGDFIENDRGVRRGWIGVPIGWSKVTGQPAFYSNHCAIARNRAAGVAIIGASGNGKSNLLMKLLYEDSESGVRCLVVDPKGDVAFLCYYLAFGDQMLDPATRDLSAAFQADAETGRLGTPTSRFQPTDRDFWSATTITDVTKASNGSLDAFTTTNDIEVGRSRALAVLQTLLNPADWEQVRSVIEEALDDMVLRPFYAAAQAVHDVIDAEHEHSGDGDGPTIDQEKRRAVRQLPEWPTMWQLPQAVNAQHQRNVAGGVVGDDAAQWRKAASLLGAIVGDGGANRGLPVARLLFARDGATGLTAGRKRRTVYTISGLTAPTAGSPPGQWRPAERAAAAVMFMLTAVCSDVLDDGTKSPKAVYVDELHVLTGLEDGRLMVVAALRTGRSRNGSMVLASQQAVDLAMLNSAATDVDGRGQGKASTNQLPTVFAFGQGGGDEAAEMADVLRPGGSDIAPLMNALLSLSTGECVMRDAVRGGGRISALDIDLGFWELFRAADTNAQSFAESHRHPVPADVADWHERPMPGRNPTSALGAA